MSFCTQCGHKNAAGSFCEECGTPLKSAPQPTTALSHAPTPERVDLPHLAGTNAASKPAPRKGVLYAVLGAIATVCLASGGAYYALRPQEPSLELFTTLIEPTIPARADKYKARYCLSNFPYDKETVYVNGMDSGTKNWLALLTQAGLYNEPESEIVQEGYFQQERLKYTKTAAGIKATDGRTLCVADGIALDKVVRFTEPVKVGEQTLSKAFISLKLLNPMPWLQSDEAKRLMPKLDTSFEETQIMLLRDRKWVLASPNDVQAANAANRAAPEVAVPKAATGTGGFLGSLKNIFGGGGNPLIGRWKSDGMGFMEREVEFDSRSMSGVGGKLIVRYEVEGKTVTVYPEGSPDGMVFTVVDQNTLEFGSSPFKAVLKRIQ